MTLDLSLVVFALEFALAHLVDAIVAMIFLHHQGVPLYITYPIMMVSTYIATYMVYSGVWKIMGGLAGFIPKGFRPGRMQSGKFLYRLGETLAGIPLFKIFVGTGKKMQIGGRWIAERHPLLVFIVFVLTPLPHSTPAIVLGLKLAKPKRVVPLLIVMNFCRTTLWVMAVYYFPVLLEFRI